MGALLQHATRLHSLAINGCDGVTCALWEGLNTWAGAGTTSTSYSVPGQQQGLNAGVGAGNASSTSSSSPGPQQGIHAWAGAGTASTSHHHQHQQRHQQRHQQQHQQLSPGPPCIVVDDDEEPRGPGSGPLPQHRTSQLRALSLVRCSGLRSLYLGLLPAGGAPSVALYAPKHYPFLDRAAMAGEGLARTWVECPTPLTRLARLRLGLSGVQVSADPPFPEPGSSLYIYAFIYTQLYALLIYCFIYICIHYCFITNSVLLLIIEGHRIQVLFISLSHLIREREFNIKSLIVKGHSLRGAWPMRVYLRRGM